MTSALDTVVVTTNVESSSDPSIDGRVTLDRAVEDGKTSWSNLIAKRLS